MPHIVINGNRMGNVPGGQITIVRTVRPPPPRVVTVNHYTTHMHPGQQPMMMQGQMPGNYAGAMQPVGQQPRMMQQQPQMMQQQPQMMQGQQQPMMQQQPMGFRPLTADEYSRLNPQQQAEYQRQVVMQKQQGQMQPQAAPAKSSKKTKSSSSKKPKDGEKKKTKKTDRELDEKDKKKKKTKKPKFEEEVVEEEVVEEEVIEEPEEEETPSDRLVDEEGNEYGIDADNLQFFFDEDGNHLYYHNDNVWMIEYAEDGTRAYFDKDGNEISEKEFKKSKMWVRFYGGRCGLDVGKSGSSSIKDSKDHINSGSSSKNKKDLETQFGEESFGEVYRRNRKINQHEKKDYSDQEKMDLKPIPQEEEKADQEEEPFIPSSWDGRVEEEEEKKVSSKNKDKTSKKDKTWNLEKETKEEYVPPPQQGGRNFEVGEGEEHYGADDEENERRMYQEKLKKRAARKKVLERLAPEILDCNKITKRAGERKQSYHYDPPFGES